jgi:hypothetical protein
MGMVFRGRSFTIQRKLRDGPGVVMLLFSFLLSRALGGRDDLFFIESKSTDFSIFTKVDTKM